MDVQIRADNAHREFRDLTPWTLRYVVYRVHTAPHTEFKDSLVRFWNSIMIWLSSRGFGYIVEVVSQETLVWLLCVVFDFQM